jgi:hypothetical protein
MVETRNEWMFDVGETSHTFFHIFLFSLNLLLSSTSSSSTSSGPAWPQQDGRQKECIYRKMKQGNTKEKKRRKGNKNNTQTDIGKHGFF